MRRPAVLLVALAFCLLAAGSAAPLAPTPVEPASAQSQEATWGQYEPDDELGLGADDELTEEELEAVVERSMVRVEEVRDVEFEERPPVTVVTREEFREEYAGMGAEPTEEQAAFENARLQALFLVGGDEDAADVQAENLDASVAGFYSPATGEIVLVSDGEQARVDEITLAHELFHAYQDAEWGLAGYDRATQDGSGADLGVVEGDAVYVETLYAERCEVDWECVIPEGAEPGADEEAGPEQPANVGLLILEFFPYDAGPAFVEHVHERGGWDAVDALYEEPPATAEQVIDPAAYPDEEPREVTIEDSHSGDWERIEPEVGPDHDRMGMAAITTMFANPLYDSGGQDWVLPADDWFAYEGTEPPAYGAFDYGSEYATGWDGDRLHAYADGDELGYVWTLAWDGPEDAETFAGGFDELLEYWGGERVEGDTYEVDEGGYEGAYHVAVEDDTVTITHAPDVDALADVSADAEPGTDEGAPEPDAEEPDADEDDAGSEELPGFGIGAALAALVFAGYLLVRRR